MGAIERDFRGLELWDVDDVPASVRIEATAAALALLDAEGVSPLEARLAQFGLEAMDDRGELDDGADLAAGDVNEAHLNAGRRAETTAKEVIGWAVPDRAVAYLRLGLTDAAIDTFQETGADPTKLR